MKATLSDKIIHQLRLKYLERGVVEYFNGGDLERKLADLFGCKPATISRELRKLTENPHEFIEKQMRPCFYSKRETVWYKYKPSKYDQITLNNYETQM